VFDVKSGALKAFVDQAITDIAHRRTPELRGTGLLARSLRRLAQNLPCLAAYDRQSLAQFNQRFQLFPFRSLQKAFVVAVHQFLKTVVRLRWKMEISNSLYPANRRGDC